MRNSRLTTLAALMVCVSSLSHPALGDLVSIEYFDQGAVNPKTNGGPLWAGVVDTVTNNLRIDGWGELPGHGAEFWVPTNLPLVWEARDSNGDLYDVPDDFGPTIGGGVEITDAFAFISPVTAQSMQWEDIDAVPQTMGTIYPPTRPGWGGFAAIEVLGGEFVFHTAAVGSDADYDEGIMPRLPVATNSMLPSTLALIKVTAREVNTNPVITAVPESPAHLAVGLVFLICVGTTMTTRWIRKRRGSCLAPASCARP